MEQGFIEGLHEASGYGALVFFGLALSVGVLIPLRVYSQMVRVHRLFVWIAMGSTAIHLLTTGAFNLWALGGLTLLGIGLIVANVLGFFSKESPRKVLLIVKLLILLSAGVLIFGAHTRF